MEVDGGMTEDLPPLVCGGCTLCCHRMRVPIVPNIDPDPGTYQTEIINGHTLLAHRPNGDCVYLGPEGCTIYERRPALCRRFDCREMARAASMKTWKVILKQNPRAADMRVVRRGKRLLNRMRFE